MCHRGAVVKELLERADKSGLTPGDAVFCFFVPFYSLARAIIGPIMALVSG